jgi:hypothetical protein
MKRRIFVFFALALNTTGMHNNTVNCQTDSMLFQNNTNTSENASFSVDSMRAVMNAFRTEQHKKILETEERIKSEICKVKDDRELIKKYIKEQALLRVSIEKKWLELLYILKSEMEPDEFTKLVKVKWGCECIDADCSCVHIKQDESPNLSDTASVLSNSVKLTKEIEQLQSEINEYRIEKRKLMWEFRFLIDEEISDINTDKRVIDQYVAKQSEIRTGIEKKWVEFLWIIKSKVDNTLFESIVKNNWGCSDTGTDCACVK